MENLKQTLKEQIIAQLNLKHLTPNDIGDDTPLFGEGDGLNLDSIDALEMIVLLQQQYGLKLADASEGPKVFFSINTMVEYISAHKKD